MLPAFGAGGIRTGTGSTRGSRHGLPLIIRSLRSSQNLRCPSAWKYDPDPSSGQASWTAALSIAVAIEKLHPHGERLAAFLGLMLIGAGVVRLMG